MAFVFTPVTNNARAQAQSDEAINRVHSAELDLEATQHQLDRLYLIVEGMWSLMKERMSISDDELGRLVESIDLRDGVLDGKAKKAVTLCTECHRSVSVRTGVCLYCGHKNALPLF